MSASQNSANKTQPTDVSVEDFIAAVEHPVRRSDAETLLEMFTHITGEEPVMWGPSIIGFGQYHYVYDSGREGDAPAVGFSPRKANLTLYVLSDHPEQRDLLARLGKHRTSVACLYINNLADVDLEVLAQLVETGYRYTKDHLDRG